MRVRVLFFGILRDLTANSELELELEVREGATAGDVVELCRAEGGRAGLWESLAIAVNQEYVPRSRGLEDGDEVALLPPVSGGQDVCGGNEDRIVRHGRAGWWGCAI